MLYVKSKFWEVTISGTLAINTIYWWRGGYNAQYIGVLQVKNTTACITPRSH